ncbi:MAG: N-acetyl-gamma-glutamyl-phosphate reductase [Acidobacteria bacterium]|nr:N-acetyl-gamma-glutamyl-phosphate reductase [Acidobacteriota bacterium]MBI3426186.1 N-acetyl-gamma-glutamyl-phosphate reductase [Acidobacteriota bacterium]
MGKTIRAIVAGATGYSGRELIRLLLNHPQIELVGSYASRTAETQPLAAIHPQLLGLTSGDCEPFDEAAVTRLRPDLIFLATPNEFSHEVVPTLLETGATIVDISGAFRLKDAALYAKYYGFEHTRPDLLKQAVYGLTEFVRAELKGAKLIANPGCYVTSVLVPLTPLLQAGLVETSQPLICDAKSGVTGAGKTPNAGTHFVEVSESLKSYNLFKHRHTPEIAQGLGLANSPAALIFTPHLLPINRGILSTIYAKLKAGVTRADILQAWQQAFVGAPFVRIFAGAQLPEIKFAANTPFCDIGCSVDEATGQAIIVSAEDNLLKGASSQALQNANLALGLDEKAGLLCLL